MSLPTDRPPGAPPIPAVRDIIVVQEDGNVLSAWGSALKSGGFQPRLFPDLDQGLEAILDRRAWWAIVIDHGFRGADALGFLAKLRAEERPVPVILTAWDEEVAKSTLARSYPWLRIIKHPVHPRVILSVLAQVPPPPPIDPSKQTSTSRLLIAHRPESTLKSGAGANRSPILPNAERDAAEKAAAEKAEKDRHEMDRAREIQSRLLPSTFPQPDGFEIAGQYLPAEHVGGDYYDVITLPDGRVAMLVADVSGKGVSAAMVMVMARTVFHSVAPGCTTARQLVLQAGDRIARDLPGGIFITCAAALLDPATAQVSVVNCGHLPPLHWSHEGDHAFVAALDVTGGAIGLIKGPIFERTLKDATFTLNPGEQLVFFTDGVNEAMDEKNEEYGDKRLHKAVKTSGGTTAGEMVQGIVDSVLYFRGDAPASDDLTVLALRRI